MTPPDAPKSPPPLFKPALFLSRLIILRKGLVVYDQPFHLGVNIIRGTNSHGKSTIADFIFYVLGGDLSRWKPEAETCDFVMAEVLANGAVLTLKREVTAKGSQPLYIYYGGYTEAAKNAAQGWLTFSYRRTEGGESFTQALFRALQMPEVQGDGASNITMHQLLRLIYVDQLTGPDLLMRFEEFDSGLIRQTVLHYLLGLFDNELYNDQLALREAQRQHEIAKAQLKNLERVLDKAEFVTDAARLRDKVKEVDSSLTATNTEIATISRAESEKIARRDGLKPLAERLAQQRKEAYALGNVVEQVSFEIEDSRQFIIALEQKLIALEDSQTTRSELGSLTLHFCPQCLAPLTPAASAKACTLCKQETAHEQVLTKLARMRQELALQIKESKSVAEQRRDEYDRNLALYRAQQEAIKRTQQDFDRLAGTVQTQRDAALDRLLQEKGRLERTLDDLRQQLKVLGVVTALREELASWSTRIQELSFAINRRKSDLAMKQGVALTLVQKYTTAFLQSDSALGYEGYFASAHNVDLDPVNNTFRLDGRNQFSASSVTLLKNSVHFSILFASLDLDFFRYPRLIVCDNIEDKGMKPERSQNFQREVVKLSRAAKVQHQIIFTTSMIAPELDIPELCVGPNYSANLKTLSLDGKIPVQSTMSST